MIEDRVYAVGDRININYYKERKQGVTANYPVKITGLLENGFLEIEFDSRSGQVDKVHEDDILKKTTRVCTMNLGGNFYKEDDITLKNKSKPHVFLSSVLYAVEEVLDYRTRDKKAQFLIKWLNKPSAENMWQQRRMLSKEVQKDGDALAKHKRYERAKHIRQLKIKKERRIKKEEDGNN
jgi:hypothetical protein